MSDISNYIKFRFAGAVAPSTGKIMKNTSNRISKIEFTPVKKRLFVVVKTRIAKKNCKHIRHS